MPTSFDKKIGLIAGVFDLVHAGHVLAFREAKEHCDYLIVALHVAPQNPSKNPPIMSTIERTTLLQACRHVDAVFCYITELQLLQLLLDCCVDIRFLGEDWKGRPITGADIPIPIHYLSRAHGYSTSELRGRVYAAEAMRLGGVREPAYAVW